MQAFYCDEFVLPLPDGHKFPMAKYALLRQRLLERGIVTNADLHVPPPVTIGDLERAHAPDYVRAMHEGTVTPAAIRALGFPWSPQLIERSKRSSGATLLACKAALREGVAVNLAGGTHHAFRDRGEGYCVFNDSAVAARALQAEGLVKRVVVIDCDVHQGNGTAALLADDPTIYTFSIHGAKNYPLRKEKSALDVELADGTGDAAYLDALDKGLRQALDEARADIAIYLAGADPYEDDRLGRLKLTKAGLAERDQLVLRYCRSVGIPAAITMAGGYARNVNDTVDIHARTIELAAALQPIW